MYESLLPPPPPENTAQPATSGGNGPMDRALQSEGVSGQLAEIARSVYKQESGSGSNTATSNAGARGGMQIIPSTFASVADRGWDINDPDQNARAGVRYLKQLYQQADGDPALTAAGYYGGPGGMQKARNGIAVSDPRNPKAPNTLQYANQVVSRLRGEGGIGSMPGTSANPPPPSAAPSDTPFYTPQYGRYGSPVPPPVPSPTVGDYAKELGASAVDSVGAMGQFLGEGAAYLANKASDSEDYVGKNLFKPATTSIRDSMTEGGKRAGQEANVEGSVLDLFSGDVKMPSSFGGWAMMGMNGLGSMMPMLVPGIGLASKAAGAVKLAEEAAVVARATGLAADISKAAQLAEAARAASLATKVSGSVLEASMTGGAAANDVREKAGKTVAGMSHEELLSGVPLYAEAFARTGDQDQSRQAVVNSAARWSAGLAGVAGAAGGAFNAKVLEDFFVKKGVAAMVGSSTSSRLGRGAISAAGLGIAEGGQEVSEKIGQNAGENLSLGRNIGDDVLRDTAGDFLGGALVGGVTGGAGGLTTRHTPTQATPAIDPLVAIEQQRQAGLAPVAAAAANGGVLSTAAMANQNTPEAKAEYAAQQQAANPAPVVAPSDPLADRVQTITEQARGTGMLDALRAENSPIKPRQFIDDLATAQSASSLPALREQAISRLEFASAWANINPAPTVTPAVKQNVAEETVGSAVTPTDPSAGIQGLVQNMLRQTGVSDADRQTLVTGTASATNTTLPMATRQAARDAVNEVVGRNMPQPAPAAVTPGQAPANAPVSANGTPALFAPKATPKGSAEEALALARQHEDSSAALNSMGYPEESQYHADQASLLREEGRVRQAQQATPESVPAAIPADSAQGLNFSTPVSTTQEPAAAAPAAPEPANIAAPSVAIPAGEGSAQLRKRRAVLAKVIADGLGTVERRNDGQFYLVDGTRKRQFKLDGPADAQLARKAVQDAKSNPVSGLTNPVNGLTNPVNNEGVPANGPARLDTQPVSAAGQAAPAADAAAGVVAGEPDAGRGAAAGAISNTGGLAAVVPGASSANDASAAPRYVTVQVAGKPYRVSLVDELAANEASPARDGRPRAIGKSNAAALRKLAAALGKKIEFFRDETLGDGFADPATPNTIYLNERSTISPLAVFGHEFLHQLKLSMPAVHASLMKVVQARLKKDGAYKFRNDYYKADAGPNPNSALKSDELEEITSDIGGNLMADTGFWSDVFAQVQKDDPATSKSMLARLAAQVYRQIDKLIENIRQGNFGSTDLVNDLKAVRAAFKTALAQYIVENNLSQAGMQAEVLRSTQAQNKADQAAGIQASSPRSAAESDPRLTDPAPPTQAPQESAGLNPLNIPGAVLSNGALTVPLSSRESANAEMQRIGSSVRFSTARETDAVPNAYAAVEARFKGTPQWLKTPNGQDTKLTERQWVHVRTPAFKAWFGNWEQFAAQDGGVFSDDQGAVSKAVGLDGEPIIVYHGTDSGGFTEFSKPGGTKRGDLGIFTTSNEEMARSYVKRGRGERITGVEDEGPKVSGVYASFLNIRTPNEADFEGANWDGSRLEQYVIEDESGEQIYSPTGQAYYRDAELDKELARLDQEDISAQARPADDHYESTDGVVREARKDQNDGAIIRQVMDDGGGRSGYNGEPSDVFVAFEPNQLKSADFNDGRYSVATDDVRFSPKRLLAEDASAAIARAATDEVEAQGKIVNLLRARAKSAGLVVDDIGSIDGLIDNALIPTITMQDLVGKDIFPTIADRTASAAIYRGIDASKLDLGIDLLGGPYFPLRLSNIMASIVWANRGKGVTSQKAAKLKEGANYMLVVLGSEDMHASNTTVSRAFVHTLEAYVRDGRASADAINQLNRLVVDTGNKGRNAAIAALDAAKAALPEAQRKAPDLVKARRAERTATTRLERAKASLEDSKQGVANRRAELKSAREQGEPLADLRVALADAIAAKGVATDTAKADKARLALAKDEIKTLEKKSPTAKALIQQEDALTKAQKNLSFFEYLSKFPGFGDTAVANLYLDSISFDGRKRIMNLMGSKAAENAGAPSMAKILDATREPELAGNRWGDGVLLVEVDQEGMQVDLGTEGTREHPDFPIGVRGRVVGKMNKAVNWELLWQDWLNTQAEKDSPRRAFELEKPIVKVTQDLIDRIGSLDQSGIDNSRQAQLAVSFASDTWSTSSTSVGNGGASPQGFIDAIASSEASATLTAYEPKALGKMIKQGEIKIFRLGTSDSKDGKKVTNGQESSIYFALKYGDPGYAEDYGIQTPGITANEVTLTSVVNNEQGARGIGGPAIILKALQEGVTVLDAFAVKSKKYPKGFLPELYASFGFEQVAEAPFVPEYFGDKQKLADAVKYWQDSTPGYNPETDGYPPLAIMKWTGQDEQRTGIVERYLRSGIESLLARGAGGNAPAAVNEFNDPDRASSKQAGTPADTGRTGGNQGAGNRAPVASRAQSVVQAVSGLNDNELKNLGLTPAQRQAARRALGQGETAPVSDTKLSVQRLSPADRIVWRDIQDVKKDVGLDALPAHITPFANFMKAMAEKAGVGALSPRDLIKAYTITRSSVNRAAVATWRATAAGLQLPDSHTDETVRPEGAFAYWLLSEPGQAYLNDAERGTVNEAAVQNAVAVMKPFGMNNTLGEDMRRAVMSDMASLVDKVSDLIDRAHQGEDVVREWQDAVDGLYGIGYAKKGFMGAMLGYGQLPTFDARQINVQASPESKKDVLAALGGKRAAEVVDKLSRRLDALDLTMDEQYLPFKQHLVHHAVWDAVGKSATTHTDVIDSMIRASAPRVSQAERDNISLANEKTSGTNGQQTVSSSAPFVRPEELIALRKRESVLESLKKCLG